MREERRKKKEERRKKKGGRWLLSSNAKECSLNGIKLERGQTVKIRTLTLLGIV